MVLRTSNGSPFIVLAPPPTVRTGIRVEIYDRDNPATLLDVLSDTRNREWLEDLNDPGSGSFEIHDLDPKLIADPTLLTYGNVARFYLNGVLRFGIRIEGIDRVQADPETDDAGRWLKVSGRGVIGILEDGIVYPAGGVGGAPDPRPYVNVASGLIIRELIAEAQARGTALRGVTTDFTDTDDSNAAPFTTLLTLDEDIGGDLLRVALRHTEMAADVWMTADLVLHYANTRGIDRTLQLVNTGPVKLHLGHNIAELSNAELGRITNTILIKTPAGFLERVDLASLGTYNRREGFLSLGNISDGATIDKTTDALFAKVADPKASSTLEIIDVVGSVPLVDFEVGDFILAPDVTGAFTKQRVRAMAVSETEAGTVRYVPQLSTVEEELEASLNRWLAAMAKGTLGGEASKVAEPNALDTQGTTSVVDAGIAGHLAGQPHHDEIGDLSDVDVTGGAALDDHLIFDGVDWIPSPFAGGGGGGGTPFAGRIVADTDQAIGVQTWTEVVFGSALLDVGAIVDLAGNGLTAVATGTYVVSAVLSYEDTIGELRARYVVDGTPVTAWTVRDVTPENFNMTPAGSVPLTLSAGQTVTLEVWFDQAGNLRGTETDTDVQFAIWAVSSVGVTAVLEVELTADESIANGGAVVPWDQTDGDSDAPASAWSGANPTRLVAWTSGWYMATASLEWETTATADRWLRFVRNSDGKNFGHLRLDVAGTNFQPAVQTSVPILLAAGDFIEVTAGQDDGSARNLKSGAHTRASLTLLG